MEGPLVKLGILLIVLALLGVLAMVWEAMQEPVI